MPCLFINWIVWGIAFWIAGILPAFLIKRVWYRSLACSYSFLKIRRDACITLKEDAAKMAAFLKELRLSAA
jgi:hypothetical protein